MSCACDVPAGHPTVPDSPGLREDSSPKAKTCCAKGPLCDMGALMQHVLLVLCLFFLAFSLCFPPRPFFRLVPPPGAVLDRTELRPEGPLGP